jgi:hypothetical protein
LKFSEYSFQSILAAFEQSGFLKIAELIWPGVFLIAIGKKAGGDKLRAGLLALQKFVAVNRGRIAGIFIKKSAKRTQALKAYREANFGNTQFATDQQVAGLFDPFLDQVLVRSFVINLTEKPDKMKARKPGLLSNFRKV